MFWTVVHRVVDLTFLILSVTILIVLLNISSDNADSSAFKTELSEVRQDMRKLSENTLTYLEGRVNKFAHSQDVYQVSTSRRLDLLESRVKRLEDGELGVKARQKVVVSNNNINTIHNERSMKYSEVRQEK